MADRLIAEGKIDLVALGRQAFCDVNFPRKVIEGRSWDINRCARCMSCMGGGSPPSRKGENAAQPPEMSPEAMLDMLIDGTGPVRVAQCPVSPERDFVWPEEGFPEVGTSKKVLVAGGGVGGIQAAISASERGHSVTLAEKTVHLGGIMRYTETDDFKYDLRNHLHLMLRRLGDSGTKLLLNTEANEELIRDEAPDVIIAAVGSVPKRSDLPGAERAIDVLDMYGGAYVGSSTIICGAGESGCEAAVYLAAKGVNVTLISRSPTIMRNSGGGFRSIMEEQLGKYGVTLMTDTAVTEFTEDGVSIVGQDGKTVGLQADSVILALGMSANTEALDELKKAAGDIPVIAVGDCVEARKMCSAVGEAMQAAYSIV